MADKRPAEEKRFIEDVTGRVRSATDDEAEAALRAGAEEFGPAAAANRYRQERDIESVNQNYGDLGQAAMGAYSGLTLGIGPALSAELAGAFDPRAGEFAKRDLQAMGGGGSYQAGEVAGMLAPALFSGGESLVGRGAAEGTGGLIGQVFGATPAGLLGNLGGAAERLALRAVPEASSALGSIGRGAVSMAARGLSEGALMNMTNTIGQSIIRDQPLTAQTLLASGADGALMGGLLGGGLGALGGAAKGLSGLAVDLGAKAGPNAALRRIGASASDVARMEEEGGLRESLRGYHDTVMEPGGVNFKNSPAEIGRVARSAVESYQKVQRGAVETLTREAPQFVPDIGRTLQRLQDEVVNPSLGTFSHAQVVKAMDKLAARLSGLGEDGGSKGFGSWQSWMGARETLANMGKLVSDKATAAGLKSKVMGIMDSELNSAMEYAGQSIGQPGLAKQFAAASAGERMASHLEEMTGRKAAQEATAGVSGISGQDLRTGLWSTVMGHPLAGIGMMGLKKAGGYLQEAVAPAIAQRAYEMSVGAQAAASVVNTQAAIKSAVGKFFTGATRGASTVGTGVKSRAEFEKRLETTSLLLGPEHQAKVAQYARDLADAHQADLGQEILATNKRAVDYLTHNLPPSTKANKSTSLMFQPTNHSLSQDEWKFFRIDEVIKKPMKLMQNIEDGTVTPEEVKAVKYVYPEVYSQVVQGVTQGIFDLKQEGKFVSLEKVTQLGIVLDAPIDPVLEPGFVADVQASMDVPQQPGPAPQRNDRIQPMNLQTPLEQMTSGANV